MHISALKNAEAFYAKYCVNLPNSALIFDFGSMDINGTLKPLFKNHEYIGIDTTPGKNVDIVCGNRKYPFTDNMADVIVSTSCFEHDEMFWVTFLEMCRVVKSGGLIYINVPSAGPYHGYPGDSWRFYKDSWKSLQAWAKINKYELDILESYIDTKCIWKNNVVVFKKK